MTVILSEAKDLRLLSLSHGWETTIAADSISGSALALQKISHSQRTIGVKRVSDGNLPHLYRSKTPERMPLQDISVRYVPGSYPGGFTPHPLPLSSQPNENNWVTFKTAHFTYRNKGLAWSRFSRLFKNKALTARPD